MLSHDSCTLVRVNIVSVFAGPDYTGWVMTLLQNSGCSAE